MLQQLQDHALPSVTSSCTGLKAACGLSAACRATNRGLPNQPTAAGNSSDDRRRIPSFSFVISLVGGSINRRILKKPPSQGLNTLALLDQSLYLLRWLCVQGMVDDLRR
jgi:hypothetical protein